jgi:NADPH2:quinone reductase
MVDRRALIVPVHGGPEVLRVEMEMIPEPAPNEVQVQVVASGVNFVEVYQREGIYPTTPPFALGAEGAGNVVALGPEAGDKSGLKVGDAVAWAAGPGSHADRVNLPVDKVVAVPEGLDLHLAAAAMLQGMTAHYLVTSTYPIAPGETALVHAAAGGVGQLLVQLIKSRGAKVIATVSNDVKGEIALGCGADAVLQYQPSAELAAAVKRENGGRGVDVVYDGVGRDTFDASLASLRPRGLLALFGASSGQVPPFEIQRLNFGGSLFLTRPTMADYVANREELVWRSGEILRAVADGSLRVEIGGRYQLDDAAQAYRDLQGRRTTGKLLLKP